MWFCDAFAPEDERCDFPLGSHRPSEEHCFGLEEEAQAAIKTAGRNINNLRYGVDTTLMAEIEELKSLLMKVKEESKKLA